MTGAELCVETEPLVLWSWNPGTRPDGEQSTTPPISHDLFVNAFEKWIDEVCHARVQLPKVPGPAATNDVPS